jgi:hypothetical protein
LRFLLYIYIERERERFLAVSIKLIKKFMDSDNIYEI